MKNKFREFEKVNLGRRNITYEDNCKNFQENLKLAMKKKVGFISFINFVELLQNLQTVKALAVSTLSS